MLESFFKWVLKARHTCKCTHMKLTVIMSTIYCDNIDENSGEVCVYQTKNKANMNKHVSAVHKQEMYKCKLCSMVFLSRSGSNEHMKSKLIDKNTKSMKIE